MCPWLVQRVIGRDVGDAVPYGRLIGADNDCAARRVVAPYGWTTGQLRQKRVKSRTVGTLSPTADAETVVRM